MELRVERKTLTSHSTSGELYLDGVFQCYTLEPPFRDDKPRAIPAGTYPLTLRWSPRFARIMPHVENVPDFEGVLIHWGNYPKDTVACLLVGKMHSEDFVGNSRAAFEALFPKLSAGTITYVDPL